MPEFYMIIARNIFFPIFFLGGGKSPCPLPPVFYACVSNATTCFLYLYKVLAKKMTVLYKLSKEQLSKQYHYDFGLRALKSVLVMAGELKRSSQDLAEDVVLMRALRDMNLPKFVFEDVPLFSGLISDLFPGLACPRVRYPDFNDAVEEVLPAVPALESWRPPGGLRETPS